MLRILVILLLHVVFYQIQSVTIEYQKSENVTERIRDDINSIDPIFRHYIIPREIQFHADALEDRLSIFLQCKGSKNSLTFTVPPSANDHLSLNTDYNTHIITATLKHNQPHSDLVGRYTCSETINNKTLETSVYVFIVDDTSVFTKRLYPKVLKETGIHFFNIPCQTTSWYPRMFCPTITNSTQCQLSECNLKEQQANELKCNIPICDGEDICIPVYYTPTDLQASKIFFDPQIGFALGNPTIPNSLVEFTCMSNYTPSQISKVPYDSLAPENIQIHQPSFNVVSYETVRLTCEIRYGTQIGRKIPTIFWFDDIYDLNLIANETGKAVFNLSGNIYSRNSSITLRGFKPTNIYRFYCVRASEQGVYSRSIEITCDESPSLDLEIKSNNINSPDEVFYGDDGSYDISVLTIPRSKIVLEITRNGISLLNDKRFELILIGNEQDQYHEYTLTIYNITFEDEIDLKIQAKSSALEKSKIIKPYVIGNPVGQFSFIPNGIPRHISWRDEDYKNKSNIYSYGIYANESFHVMCTVRHRSDIQQPLNIFIQQIQCSINNCLSDIIDNKCQSTTGQHLKLRKSKQINEYRTEFISNDPQILNDSSTGHQYICCYEQNIPLVLAKGLTALAHNREMFTVRTPEFSLVTGDVLTYRCEIHELIYDDLQMTYNDGHFTYKRNRFDPAWRVVGTNQPKEIDIDWSSPTSDIVYETPIEVKTRPFRKIGKNGDLQCTAFSKRPDVIKNMTHTYVINVDDPVLLQFKNNLSAVVRIDKKAGTNVELDCSYIGRPTPKITWLNGTKPLIIRDSALQLRDHNGSINITRAQTSDTGYYTCQLTNGRDPNISRSFDLRIKGPILSLLIMTVIIISACIILLLLIFLIIVGIKYFQMKKIVDKSYFNLTQPDEVEDKSQPPMTQLSRIRLPDNFASTQQVRTLLSYVNGDTLPNVKDHFKELGHGQFGVVYQVYLPDVGLVAAKLLPETVRNIERHHDKQKKTNDLEENQEMIEKQKENQMKKAAEMLIDEIKVMYKAGKHVDIVSLIKVAYPEAKIKYVLRGGIIRDEDSFYLMELCSNGSLESMLKHFLQPTTADSWETKLSLYETLSKQRDRGMTITEALNSCQLTDDDLKLIAYQVASGVDYLNRIQIAHCDIAARNVLVTSRFIMKICDFGLATWTTYKNYREQLAEHDSVQLEKKNNELATHNLTPELARGFLRASTPDERILLNKPSMKSDVWSFGIFLWTLFLKCRIRPFHKLSEEIKNQSAGQSFFHQLARVVSEGRVLEYINYRSEIPEEVYAVIRVCLVDESERPEMSRIRSYLCHQNMLSKQAFEYYRSEYNHYQEENATDEKVIRFGEDQGVSDLPSFDGKVTSDDSNSRINYRRNKSPANDYSGTPSDQAYQSYRDYSEQRKNSYLVPKTEARAIVGNESDKMISLVEQTDDDSYLTPATEPRAIMRNTCDKMTPLVEQTNDDSYLTAATEPRTIVGNESDKMISLVEQTGDDSYLTPATEPRAIMRNTCDEMIPLGEQTDDDSYLTAATEPRTIVRNESDRMIPLVEQTDDDSYITPATEARTIVRNACDRMIPLVEQTDDDSYLTPTTQPGTIVKNACDKMIGSVEQTNVDSYLTPTIQPRAIMKNACDKMIGSVEQTNDDSYLTPIPRVGIKKLTPIRLKPQSLTKRDDSSDSYL